MEGFTMSDNEFKLAISSQVQDYTVQETGNWLDALESLIAPGDPVMIDPAIYHGYSEQIDDLIQAEGAFICPPFEGLGGQVKTLTHVVSLLTEFLEKGVSRQNRLFVIGGGSLMDLGGFAASVYMRGIKWVYFPTTLLSQADSCIGGKTSLNLGGYKNIIGTIWPPEGVLIDRSFLLTLPHLEQLSGVGEMLHFFMVQGGAEYEWAKDQGVVEMTNPDPDAAHEHLARAARATLEIKKRYIETDERDTGERRLLNFGHTFGHAIEAIDPLVPHGIAVARGIEIAADISWNKGFVDNDTAQEMADAAWQVYSGFRDPFRIEKPFALVKALQQDKKRGNKPGVINVILTRGPGEMFEAELSTTEIAEFLGA
jgi:3-dehydroquinate synthase